MVWWRIVSVMLIVAVLGSGCRAMTGKSAGDNVDDATITASVKARLVRDAARNLTRIDVDTNNATVYLTGTVESSDARARAEQLAWQATGVKAVVNNLQVQKK